LQRRLSRKKKYSKNWNRQKDTVSKCHAKISNCRKDFLHKITTTISKNHAVVVLEDLKVSQMSKSAKGTVESPGKNVKAKSGLNKSILDQGWHEFRRQLDYKLRWLGGKLLLIRPEYTSKQCSECDCLDNDNRKSQAVFECVACGHKAHADFNAAKNIRAAGLAVLGCGGDDLSHPMKQQPTVLRSIAF
jgi:putative transposase